MTNISDILVMVFDLFVEIVSSNYYITEVCKKYDTAITINFYL